MICLQIRPNAYVRVSEVPIEIERLQMGSVNVPDDELNAKLTRRE